MLFTNFCEISGFFLRDLVLNNENTIFDSNGNLDFQTMKTVAVTIKEIQKYQINIFTFDENSSVVLPALITNLEKLNYINDDEVLYQMSLQVCFFFILVSGAFGGHFRVVSGGT